MPQNYTVPDGIRQLRADKALAIAFPEYSRTALQRAFDAEHVTLRGAAIKRDQSVNNVSIRTARPQNPPPNPEGPGVFIFLYQVKFFC